MNRVIGDWRVAGLVALMCACLVPAMRAQAPAAGPPASAEHAKELAGLLTSKNLEAFAVKDAAEQGRFIAVLIIPGAQLLVVSAVYDRPSDIEYFIYQKDYRTAYINLNTSVLSKSKILVADTLCDGLKAVPPKDGGTDSITVGADTRTFDGVFDSKKHDSKKISQDEYMQSFSDADAKYDHMLTALLEELKK